MCGWGLNFFHLFETLMERCDVSDLELMVVVAWKIFRRNRVVHGGEFIPPQQLLREANMLIDDFRRVTTTDLATRSAIHTASLLTWLAPPTSIYKVNWDAAIDKT
jgi:hypothetical protein